MNKKILTAALLAALMGNGTSAQDSLLPHLDLETISICAQTARPELFFYDSKEAALKGLESGPESSPFYLNLNGIWDFAYYRDGREIPDSIDSITAWNDIKVPGNWEVQGYGDAIYVNTTYEFAQKNPQPPRLPDAIEAGVYHRTFTVPEGWEGHNVYLTLAGASAGVYVYANGSFVGYHEDSKSAARYDVTPFLKDGDNDLFVKIFRWSTGSYLECQDFWRISGIERDVYLSCESRDIPSGLDVDVVSTFGEDLRDGIFRFGTSCESAQAWLYDADGKVIASGKGCFEAIVKDARKWTAETPELYTLVIGIGDWYTSMDVGFRRFEFSRVERNGKSYPVFLVNGQPVKFKGVNLHEHNPLTGHYTDKELILKDLLLMKSLNINAIRTCHYPQPREFYELCDRLGFYVYDEANIESHGMGYSLERTLGNNPAWGPKHMDRLMNMYCRTRNYPCVTILSLGNEAGNGVNFYDCYRALKALETKGMNRPVCYERAVYEWNTDMLVPQYPGADWFKGIGERIPDRPACPSEYAHAMGNSTGSLDLQWKYIYEYPNLQGGFIWDWVDQGLLETDDAGQGYFTYGGDYGENLPSDGNFNCNGIVNPDRTPHPAAAEVKWNYQDIKVSPVSIAEGRFEVLNRFYFKSLSGYTLEWVIEEDGVRRTSGRLGLGAAAQETEAISIRIPSLRADREAWVKFFARDASGNIAAYDAYKISDAARKPYGYDFARTKVSETDNLITLSAGRAAAVYDKSQGYVVSYSFAGKELIDSDFGLRPNFWRAPTDNDNGNGAPRRAQRWRNASESFDATAMVEDLEGFPAIKVTYSLPESGTFILYYRLDASGVLRIDASLDAGGNGDVEIPRYGLRLRTYASGPFQYCGRGPQENYQDRFEGTLPGIYASTAEAEFYPYVRPQETGHHTGARWLDIQGSMTFAGDDFEFNVLGFSTEDLEAAGHINEVPVRDYIEVCIDGGMTGVGGYDSWGSRPERSRTLWSDRTYRFGFSIVPDASPARKYSRNYGF